MISSISKPKIPNDYSYVLKTKQLEDLLVENNIDTPIDLYYSLADTIITAYYYPPNYRVPYCRFCVVAGALLRDDVFFARDKMKETILPELAIWMNNILNLPENSTTLLSRDNLRFIAKLRNNEVVIKS